MIPKRKNGELELIDLGAKYEYDRELFNALYVFLKDTGLLTDPEDRKKAVIDFHQKVCLENEAFPGHVPYKSVYYPFLSSCLNRDTVPESIEEVVDWFSRWVPLQDFPEPPRNEDDETKGPMSNWTDYALKSQWEKVKSMYPEENLRRFVGMKTTFAGRLLQEIERRGIKPGE